MSLSGSALAERTPLRRTLAALEWDPRLAAMVGVLALVWTGLDLATDGVFLTPRNLYNLALQSSVVAVMATGMVWVIVTRHIDLSVGSVLGFSGMAVAVLQAEWWAGSAAAVPASIAAGLVLGTLIGAWHGWWVAYRGLPAFVVTLAGLLIFRGAAFLLTDGRTVAPLDPVHQMLGGGVDGSLGAAWSRGLGGLAVAVAGIRLLSARSRRREHEIPTRPVWAELVSFALVAVAIAGFVEVMNAYTRPRSDVARGIPVPVLVALAVAAVMSAITRSRRFGRYVFAIGGSPAAARRAGIDVRRVTVGVFAAMGLLAAIGGVLTTARLGAGTNSMGTLAELAVIAAAVLGGTSLAGGAGSIAGALLGAVLMQSLENGMVLMGVSSPMRQVWIGLVLIAAVQLDMLRRRGQVS